MRHRQITRGLGVLTIVCGLLLSNSAANATLPFIQSHGTQFVDESGAPVTLKGCNLGNYLLIELWMFGGCIEAPDQAHLFAKLDQRFGGDRARHLVDVYRQSWITPRDFDLIRSFGFNIVRLPIDYRLLQSDAAPYEIKPDGFKYVDHVLDMAETAGVYVILDLHAAPGGQSDDQCTGEKGANKLWNNPVDQQRTADVWRAMAARYRDRSTVAGYDLMNEPYADHHMDVRGDLRKIMSDCYTAIRGTGDKHVMFFPGALGKSPEFYGDPHTTGWTNVGFTEHFYPGLFGDKVAFESHLRTLTKTFPARQQWLDRVQSPYYVGEFNPVLDAIGGPRITRAYYDAFARHGWAGTLWSYKIVKPAGGASSNTWYCVSNADSLPRLNLDSSSYEDFEQFFAGMATAPLAVNQPLLKALTEHDPAPLPLGGETEAGSQVAPPETSLLKNGSFEDAGATGNLADNWNSRGGAFTRETDAASAHSGSAMMVGHSAQAKRREGSDLSQDVPAVAGKRYRFTVFEMRDGAGDSGSNAKVELRLEGNLDGHVITLNSTTVSAPELGTDGKWTKLSVDGTAIGDTLRVRIILTGSGARDGFIRFDDAALQTGK